MPSEDTQFKPGVSGCPAKILRPGHRFRWAPGQSGNPAGVPATRRAFEQAFYAALLGEGSPAEAARLLWECARAKEPWAVQLLLQRLAPQENTVRLEVARGDDDGFDPSRLTDEQLGELTRLLEIASGETRTLEGGTVPPEFDGVHPGSVADR